jgi:hypothetical protein
VETFPQVRLRPVAQDRVALTAHISLETAEKQTHSLDDGLLEWRRMGFVAPVRAFLSILVLAAVVFAAAAGECAACGFPQGARVDSGDCCKSDGSCDMALGMAGCIKSHSTSPAVVEQAAQAPQATATHFELAVNAENRPSVIWPQAYSTPPLHLLNSALLI